VAIATRCLLAARELVGVGVGLIRHPDLVEKRERPLSRVVARHALDVDRPFHDVLDRGAMREQVEALENHPGLAADRVDGRGAAIDARAVDRDRSAIVGFEAVDAAQKPSICPIPKAR
jgi:hypothetical protein